MNFKMQFFSTGVNKYSGILKQLICLLCFAVFVNNKALTQALQPGSVTSGNQIILANTYPSPFIASSASGGSCGSGYYYQWQESIDNVSFSDIAGAGYQNLSLLNNATTTKYYRRRVTCSGVILFTPSILVKVITPAIDENKNYVREIMINKPGVLNWQEADLIPIGDKFESTSYLDGFGRPVQKLNKGISSAAAGAWKDLVDHYEYDAAGREVKDFLPYATSDNPGKFKTNAATAQPAYVTAFFGEPATAPTYSLTQFDDSPLSKVMKSTLTGEGWKNSGIFLTYDFNKDIEKVHIWSLAYTVGALPTTGPALVYPTGTLQKNTITDENGNKVITYTDLEGNLILKKVQDKDIPLLTNEHSGWVCTYYIYDDMNHLRFIISPKAVEYLDNNGWALNQTIVNELCFVYGYDDRERMTNKKQPGAGEQKMIYDKKDRLVLTQHATQDKVNNPALTINQWSFVLYDELNRTVASGLLSNNGTQATLQTAVNALSNLTVSVSATLGISGSQIFSVDNPVAGSSGTANYLAGTSNIIFNSITHYDRYTYTGVKTFNNTYTFAYPGSTPNIEQTIKTDRTTGMVTGEKIRVLDGDNNNANDKFLFSTAYYDEKERDIQILIDNIKGGLDYEVFQYDFASKLMSNFTSHFPGGSVTHTVITKNEYDKAGRLIKLSKNFNNSFYKQLAEYAYDELGQLKTRRLAPGYNASEIESLTYSYNIQGWLTGINKDYALGNNNYTQWDRFFGIYLGYDNRDNIFATPQLNGNITGIAWRSQGDNSSRKFDFTYDRLDQLTSALFKQKKRPADVSWLNTEVDFSTTITYEDGNGNIKSMKHMGIIPGVNNGVVTDDLRYSYLATGVGSLNGNKLKQVDDLGTLGTNNGLLGDFKDINTTQDYYYDVNGNLVKDLNKNVKNAAANGITYNFLNKPEKIVIEGKSTVEFTYDASGEKLKKKVTLPDNTWRETIYIGDFVYEEYSPGSPLGTGGLQYVLHEEGRLKIITPHVKANDNDYELNAGSAGITNWPGGKQAVFEYFIKDHLGSTRMVLTEEVQKEYYKASMDLTAAAQEEPLFGKVNTDGTVSTSNELKLTRLPNTLPTPTVWPGNNTDVVKLTASAAGKVMGPNMILKVMAGDIINSNVSYYYLVNNATGTGPLLNDMIGSFVNALNGNKASVLGKNQSGAVNTTLTANTDLSTFIGQHNGAGTAPKAYLNVVFLDEQFKFISNDPVTPTVGSNFVRVSSNNNPGANMTLQQKAPKNGWAFVFVSNESNETVYFDNLLVSQEHSRNAEESHYYPFGLKIAGISSKAFNKLSNKYNYQGDFAENEEETAWDEFDLRMYDAQIGRWTGVDPYDGFFSPYLAMGNNPVAMIDPDGGDPEPPIYMKKGGKIIEASYLHSYADFLEFKMAEKGFEYLGTSPGHGFARFIGFKKLYRLTIGWNYDSFSIDEFGEGTHSTFISIFSRSRSGLRKIVNYVPVVSGLIKATESFAQGNIGKGLLHLADAASDVYSLGGASLLKIGAKELFRKVVIETVDNAIQREIGISPKLFTKAVTTSGIGQGHHPYPKFLGGPSKQDLINLATKTHQRLHKDLIKFLKEVRTKTGVNMVPGPGNSGRNIIKKVDPKTRKKAVKDFYRKTKSKYKSSGDSFNKQFGGK